MFGGSSLVAYVIAIGIPALAVLFYFEGLIIGKLLQPPIIFVGFVAATGPSHVRLLGLGVFCVLAATLGQWTLYRGFDEDSEDLFGIRKAVPYLDSVPERARQRVGEDRLETVGGYLDQYGIVTILVANSLPVIRGIPTIVAGTSNYPLKRFLLASVAGNVVYVCLLSGAALGIGALRRVFV